MSKKSKKLLFSLTKKDFKLDWFSGNGNGGQNRNKHQNCLRLFHPESGARSVGQSNKSRLQNQKEALNNLIKTEKFQNWHKIKVGKALGILDNIEKEVDKLLNDKNIKFEIKENGKWKTVDSEYFEINVSDLEEEIYE